MSEYDQYKKEKQALIEARKLKVSTPDGGAGLLNEVEPQRIVPTTFKEKWSNYWYHYKGRTFGIAIAVVLVTIFTCEMIFKTVYDGSIAVVTEYPMDVFNDQITAAISNPEILDDYTGNDKLDAELSLLQVDPEGKYGGSNPQMMQASVVKLSAKISAMDGFIYLVDDRSYEYLLGLELTFMDLSDKTDKSHLIKGNDRYSLKGTKLAEDIDLGEIVDDLSVCFFDYDTLEQKTKDKKNIKKAYERDIALFENILEYE